MHYFLMFTDKTTSDLLCYYLFWLPSLVEHTGGGANTRTSQIFISYG